MLAGSLEPASYDSVPKLRVTFRSGAVLVESWYLIEDE
jgi:hypothetical protein